MGCDIIVCRECKETYYEGVAHTCNETIVENVLNLQAYEPIRRAIAKEVGLMVAERVKGL